MSFFPLENITYKTKLKEDEIIKRLSNFVEPRTFLFGAFATNSTKPYEGQISGQSFNIKRIINYQINLSSVIFIIALIAHIFVERGFLWPPLFPKHERSLLARAKHFACTLHRESFA